MSESPNTTVVDKDLGIVVCDDCGASTVLGDADAIEHYDSCKPGASEFWENFYNSAKGEE